MAAVQCHYSVCVSLGYQQRHFSDSDAKKKLLTNSIGLFHLSFSSFIQSASFCALPNFDSTRKCLFSCFALLGNESIVFAVYACRWVRFACFALVTVALRPSGGLKIALAHFHKLETFHRRDSLGVSSFNCARVELLPFVHLFALAPWIGWTLKPQKRRPDYVFVCSYTF